MSVQHIKCSCGSDDFNLVVKRATDHLGHVIITLCSSCEKIMMPEDIAKQVVGKRR